MPIITYEELCIKFSIFELQPYKKIDLVDNNYYYQVQAQLNITERNYCNFVVWTPNVDKKKKNDVEFLNSKIEPFVTTFNIDFLLPEIIYLRFERRLPIRSVFLIQ
ncbi:YqaJ domain-containing protein [Aphis craccivora]|uniref:YqaJ domain-containing protein n=1 Tax=Aphis craccivora TaxID=307492 RepID=A0A6G0YMV3_APHCR|nr:YqaJ domain-containing protein [Aphis craccivora]